MRYSVGDRIVLPFLGAWRRVSYLGGNLIEKKNKDDVKDSP